MTNMDKSGRETFTRECNPGTSD